MAASSAVTQLMPANRRYTSIPQANGGYTSTPATVANRHCRTTPPGSATSGRALIGGQSVQGKIRRRTASEQLLVSNTRMSNKQMCQGFVGESTPPAAQYHCNDFEWETLRDEAEALLKERADYASESPSLSGAEDEWEHTAMSWEDFHCTHSSARFFKEKRYLLLEFPVLADDTRPQHVLEIGCGCGSSILPVLKSNHAARATVCDVSPTAVRLLQEAAASAEIDTERIKGFAADASTSQGAQALAGLSADACLMIFTLSAVMPGNDMHTVLRSAYDALRPGGVLLFRDYALYDMPQMRFPEEQRLGDRLYRRLDGTLSYFFTTEDLSSRAEAAGFETEECSYACVLLKNRKTGAGMKRAFVHGIFRKPHV